MGRAKLREWRISAVLNYRAQLGDLALRRTVVKFPINWRTQVSLGPDCCRQRALQLAFSRNRAYLRLIPTL
jgi:hypothetical protein